MLVFGGLVRRNRYFVNEESGEEFDIYNYCEDLERATVGDMQYYLRTCGEEFMRDVWLYNIKHNFWTYIKPDFNGDIYLYVK